MKKFFFAICALAAVATACTPEVETSPAVSFETALPVVAGEVATFTITVADYSGTEAVTIPVTFGGDAVKGTDYEVSAEAFVWGGENPVTTIKVTTLNFDSSKKVSLALEIPEGWMAGNYPMSEMSLSAKLGYVSFEKSAVDLTGNVDVKVSVLDDLGNEKVVENDVTFAIAVSETSSAVEGEHFTVSTKNVTIPAGSKSATFTVSMIGDEPVVGHDEFTLVLDPGVKFSLGSYGEVAVSIWGSVWPKLQGQWAMNEIVTTAESLDAEWWGMCTFEGLPEFNAADAISFDVAAGKAVASFSSTYKNYFLGESNIVKVDNYYLRTGMGGAGADLLLIEFDNINRYFHASEVSEDDKALVGFRIINDEETGEELLDMYIIDHTSKSFMPELLDFEMYDSVKPVAAMTGTFLNATFKKVN
jgi:hypothetical protein